MSVFEIVLLAIFVVLELVFFSVLIFFRVTEPIDRRDGRKYISDNRKHGVWNRRVSNAQKRLNPLRLHIVALSALALWVIIRVVISFL